MFPVLTGSVCLLCGHFLTPQHTGGALPSSAGLLGPGPSLLSDVGPALPRPTTWSPGTEQGPGDTLPPSAPPPVSASRLPFQSPSSWSCPQLGKKPKNQQVAVHSESPVGLVLKGMKPPFLQPTPTPSPSSVGL